jgi:hypothetical protein
LTLAADRLCFRVLGQREGELLGLETDVRREIAVADGAGEPALGGAQVEAREPALLVALIGDGRGGAAADDLHLSHDAGVEVHPDALLVHGADHRQRGAEGVGRQDLGRAHVVRRRGVTGDDGDQVPRLECHAEQARRGLGIGLADRRLVADGVEGREVPVVNGRDEERLAEGRQGLEAHAARRLREQHAAHLLALAAPVHRDVSQGAQVGDRLPARRQQVQRAAGRLGDRLPRRRNRHRAAGRQREREEGEGATATPSYAHSGPAAVGRGDPRASS